MSPDLAPAPSASLDTAAVFREHAAYVWRVLRRLGVAERDVEDVCQEVFMVVHRRRADFEGRSSVRTWVYGVCVRTASDYRRRAVHRREVMTESPPEQASLDDPHAALSGREAREALDEILSELDDDKRAVFVLHEIEQASMADVAEAVGCPLQTAYSRLHAARAKVQGAIERMRVLEAGREERPTPAQLAAVATKLGPVLGGGGAAAMGGAAVKVVAAKGLVAATTTKVAIVVVALAVTGVAARKALVARPATPTETTTVSVSPTPVPTLAPIPNPTPTPIPTPLPSPTPTASSPAASSPSPDPDRETLLLDRARSDLDTNPALALSECDALAKKYPHGLLDQEREVVAITALVRLGRRQDAQKRADRFAAAHPGSPYLRRIDAVLER